MLTRDSKFYDVVSDKEEDVVGNLRMLCGHCKKEVSIVMAILYNKEHIESRIDKCPHCGKLNLIWDKKYVYA